MGEGEGEGEGEYGGGRGGWTGRGGGRKKLEKIFLDQSNNCKNQKPSVT